MSSGIDEYLGAVDGERGESLRAVYRTVAAAMPEGYDLIEFRGAPLWAIPLSTFPVTYNKEPLSYVGLMAQKNYNSLYLMGLYSDSVEDAEFRAAWTATGLKLDMGKSCLRFRTLADVNLDLIAATVASMPVERFIGVYERVRQTTERPARQPKLYK